MIRLIEEGTISGKMAKDLIQDMYKTGKPPRTIIAEKGMVQITDEGALATVIDEIIAANPNQLAQYRSGKDKLFGYFVGQVMKATQGKANPQLINELLKKKLDQS
jgi:aspartyl-tRNA(Asn)/glutamyl-tRNA(Gln) amidotransferase subunit B